MDKIIEKKPSKWRKYIAVIIGATVAFFIVKVTFQQSGEQTLKVDSKGVMIDAVFDGNFDDFILIRGTVEPLDTLFIDAVEGGRVETIYVEDGDLVKHDQVLMELSNPAVQLSLIRTQAETTQQLNDVRQLELQIEQSRLKHKSDIVDIEYNITLLESKLKRQRKLVKIGAVQKSEIEENEISYKWYNDRLVIAKESKATDDVIQGQLLTQLAEASEQLEQNMDVAKKSIERLVVKAPSDGRLTAFNLKVGESVSAGSRLGRVSDPTASKLIANLDEFYINSVRKGLLAETEIKGAPFKLKIDKVYPQVANGRFRVDLVFEGSIPPGILRGQTLQGRLQIGNAQPAVLVKNGAFYQSTGGNWVFVVSSDGSEAIKRTVELGRRNANVIEVVKGLKPGEKIITSSYQSYTDVTRLKFK